MKIHALLTASALTAFNTFAPSAQANECGGSVPKVLLVDRISGCEQYVAPATDPEANRQAFERARQQPPPSEKALAAHQGYFESRQRQLKQIREQRESPDPLFQ